MFSQTVKDEPQYQEEERAMPDDGYYGASRCVQIHSGEWIKWEASGRYCREADDEFSNRISWAYSFENQEWDYQEWQSGELPEAAVNCCEAVGQPKEKGEGDKHSESDESFLPGLREEESGVHLGGPGESFWGVRRERAGVAHRRMGQRPMATVISWATASARR
jgi:hypothetical protein